MASQVCGKCFKTTSSQYDKASFCAYCGASFLESFMQPSKPASIAATLRQMPHTPSSIVESEDDEYEINPSIARQNKQYWRSKQIDASIEGIAKPHGLKLIEAAMAGGDVRPQESKSAEQVMEELRKENGAIKATPIEFSSADRSHKLINPQE